MAGPAGRRRAERRRGGVGRDGIVGSAHRRGPHRGDRPPCGASLDRRGPRCQAGRYRLSRSGRRWLHPDSGLSVARFVAGTADYWSWWSGLDEVTRGAPVAGHHDAPPGDPYWRRYIGGQSELARLSAAEVARTLRLPGHPGSVLDIGGGHGWYSAQLCRRYRHLTATVLDLPGSAAIGREIIAAAGLSD